MYLSTHYCPHIYIYIPLYGSHYGEINQKMLAGKSVSLLFTVALLFTYYHGYKVTILHDLGVLRGLIYLLTGELALMWKLFE